jgi:hypothetical protein
MRRFRQILPVAFRNMNAEKMLTMRSSERRELRRLSGLAVVPGVG